MAVDSTSQRQAAVAVARDMGFSCRDRRSNLGNAAFTCKGPPVNAVELCDHLQPGTWPLRVDLVLDEQVTFTDALATCRLCGRAYLLEMLDWRNAERVLRIAVVDAEGARGVLRDLSRGSCDIRRAGAEVHHLRASAAVAPFLLLIDSRAPVIVAMAAAPGDPPLPTASWRTLPCDGRWVDYIRSSTEIVNE